MKRGFPPSFYNPITFSGVALASLSFLLILFMILIEMTSGYSKPYVGIIAFIILPTFLIIGLALVFLGALWQRRRIRRGIEEAYSLPVIDLNDPRYRRTTAYVVFGSVIFLMFSAFGSFKAFEYTESNQFCGEMCHEVMSPEYTAYKNSPHARVACVDCHIGPGTDWFVRSKLSGAYQVYATMFNLYPRPIPTPVENLRPAKGTCEQCHWPEHFFNEKRHSKTYFLQDEQNTQFNLDFLVKIGGGTEEGGASSGIHYHMNIARSVEYIPSDASRQTIPWMKVTMKDGSVSIFQDVNNPLTDEEVATMKRRQMDCVDCHNRPSHIYNPPTRSVNHVMALGWIDPSLPNIKMKSLELLEGDYTTHDGAEATIRIQLAEYYQSTFPDLYEKKKAMVDRAADALVKIYRNNYFPVMKVSWKRFPENIGHMFAPGCFRCHDGQHANEEGKIITKDCNSCHTLIAQKKGDEKMEFSLDGLEYRHPEDIGDAWKDTNCSDCHGAN